jgi:hypothetical protein
MYNLNGSFSGLNTLTDHYGFNWNYLNKVWNISSSNAVTVGNEPYIRLYYTDAEFTAFRQISNCYAFVSCNDEDMVMLQATGLTEDCDATNNSLASAYRFYWYKNPSNYANEKNHIDGGLANSSPLYGGTKEYYGDISGAVGAVVSTANTELDGRYFQARVRSFSEFRLFLPANDILPVRWFSFTGQLINNSYTKLNWSTSEEKETVRFEIERSFDGRSFVKIGQVNAAGNSAIARDYQFNDNTPAPGKNYYRIKVIDRNNKTQYSIVVTVVLASGFILTDIHPNPVQSVLNMELVSEKNVPVTEQVIDIAGKLILTRNEMLQKGTNRLQWNIVNIPPGTYFLKLVTANGSQQVKQFVKY